MSCDDPLGVVAEPGPARRYRGRRRADLAAGGFSPRLDYIYLGSAGSVGFHINFVDTGHYLFECVVASDPD